MNSTLVAQEGVWLIKEVLPLEQTLFQVINKGSTEDW